MLVKSYETNLILMTFTSLKSIYIPIFRYMIRHKNTILKGLCTINNPSIFAKEFSCISHYFIVAIILRIVGSLSPK